MKLAKLLALGALLLLGAGLAGCSDDTNDTQSGTDAGCDPATDPACSTQKCDLDEDCGDPRLFMCVDSVCKAVCTDAADCSNHPHFNGAWPGCEGALGCACEERTCKPTACTADSECGTLVCKAGECVAPDTAPDKCVVLPDVAVMRAGQPFTFSVVAYKGGQPASLGANPFTWSALNGAVELVSGSTFNGKESTAGASAEAVKAEIAGGISCTARVVVYGELGANKARVVVIDELSRRPVSGATVVVDGGSSRITMNAENGVTGSYVTTTELPANATVSVFHNDFQYVTLVGVAGRDLLVPIRRNPLAKSGGFKGEFKNLPTTLISAGIAGTSIAGGFTDLEPEVILGPTEDTPLKFGALDIGVVPMPSGVAIGTKTEFRALGVSGTCSSTTANEDAVLAGGCGTSSAWGLMGTIPLGSVGEIYADYKAGTFSLGKALAAMMPHIKTFKSAVSRDVEYTLQAGEPDFTKFSRVDFTPEVELSVSRRVKVPTLPSVMDGAVVVSGAMVESRGLIPLGVGAGLDTNEQFATADGQVIRIETDSAGNQVFHNDGTVQLQTAPNHGGIEGSQYAVVTLAIPTKGSLANGALATSGLVKITSALPKSAEADSADIDYAASFPELSDTARYGYRTSQFTNAKVVAGALNRMVFVGPDGHLWTVYYKDASFTMPEVPSSQFEDRTMATGLDRDPSVSANSFRAPYIAQVIKTSGGVDMEKLFAFDEVNATEIARITSGFSIYELMTDIVFVSVDAVENGAPVSVPCSGGCDVKAGNVTVKARVTGFSIPTEGQLKITIGNETKTATVGADGIASADFTLGAGSHGVTGRLVGTDGTTAIDPPVESYISVDAQ